MPKIELEVYEMYKALRSARFGLECAGADKKLAKGEFVPTETLALREVREVLSKVEAARPEFRQALEAEHAEF